VRGCRHQTTDLLPPIDERFMVGPLMGVGGVTGLCDLETASVYMFLFSHLDILLQLYGGEEVGF
jgi:hypothetical protein